MKSSSHGPGFFWILGEFTTILEPFRFLDETFPTMMF